MWSGYMIMLSMATGMLLVSSLVWFSRVKRRRAETAAELCLVLLQLTQEIQRHRGLSMAALNGNHEFDNELLNTETTLRQAFVGLASRYGRRHQLFAERRWENLMASCISLCNNWRYLDTVANLYAHNALVLCLMEILQSLAGDRPSQFSRQRQRVIAEWLPLVEHLGMLRALGMQALSLDAEDLDAEVTASIDRHRRQALTSLDELTVPLPDHTVYGISESLLRRLEDLAQGRPGAYDARDFNLDITGVIDRWYRIMNICMLKHENEKGHAGLGMGQPGPVA